MRRGRNSPTSFFSRIPTIFYYIGTREDGGYTLKSLIVFSLIYIFIYILIIIHKNMIYKRSLFMA